MTLTDTLRLTLMALIPDNYIRAIIKGAISKAQGAWNHEI